MVATLPPNDAVGREIEIDALRPVLGSFTKTRGHQNQESEESGGQPARHRRIRLADVASFGFNGDVSPPFNNYWAPRILIGVP